MSKRRKKIDPNQSELDFDSPINEYRKLRENILSGSRANAVQAENYDEACIEIAAAIKRMLRESGMSREEVVDAINEYFGWSPPPAPSRVGGEKTKAKPLSIHMFNHYLSKPAEYPMPTVYVFAIHHITRSLEVARLLAEAEEGRVVSKGEVRELALGKLDNAIQEMQRLKKEFRGMKR